MSNSKFWLLISRILLCKSGFAIRHISNAYFETAARSTVIYGYHSYTTDTYFATPWVTSFTFCLFTPIFVNIKKLLIHGLEGLKICQQVNYMAFLRIFPHFPRQRAARNQSRHFDLKPGSPGSLKFGLPLEGSKCSYDSWSNPRCSANPL